MAERKGAGKSGRTMVVCLTPDVCKTPMGSSTPPVPYQICATFADSQSTSTNVRFGGEPAFMLDQSTISHVTGDEAGTAGGVVSGTHKGQVVPVEASTTVRVNGKYVVRHGDTCQMNNGNTTGKVICQSGGAPGCGIGPDGLPDKDCDPPITPEAPEEKSFLENLGDWWAQTKAESVQSANQPLEGVKGAAKESINAAPAIGELLIKGFMLQKADELEQTAYMSKLLGMQESSDQMLQSAAQIHADVDKVSLPKFELSNPAQEGGAKIAAAAQLLTGLGALLKSGLKQIAKKTARAGTQPTGMIDDAARQGRAIAKEGQAGVIQGRDGVKISPKTPIHSSDELRGVENATSELKDSVQRKGRTIHEALPGSDDLRYLDSIPAEAAVGGPEYMNILVRQNPSKAAVLEEFLHGTQHKLGIIDRLGRSGAETHVKDFMIRHRRILGLGAEDVKVLQQLKDAGL